MNLFKDFQGFWLEKNIDNQKLAKIFWKLKQEEKKMNKYFYKNSKSSGLFNFDLQDTKNLLCTVKTSIFLYFVFKKKNCGKIFYFWPYNIK